ncbi:MAG: hypothetical protein AABZ15_11595 [Nitrospirota bacterium]
MKNGIIALAGIGLAAWLTVVSSSRAEAPNPCAGVMEETKKEYGDPASASPWEKTKGFTWEAVWLYPAKLKVTFASDASWEPCQRTIEYLHEDGSIRSYPQEPVGFRDFKWGASIGSIKGLLFVLKDTEGIKYYSRKNDSLKIGDAKLTSLNYGFWKGNLHSVVALFKGNKNWEMIRGSLSEKFGTGLVYNRGFSMSWRGEKTSIITLYNDVSNDGSLLIYSEKIQGEIDQEKKADLDKSIKRGAATGF